ncbi:anti-phage dCTP deaminase [Methylomonas methanica]|uniref:CMP/dCMP deaminase zinc-binding protein n=1 Tax=Methylomonas methanica (strain DSM 25384 / MC09) TaxID=857087 RepID=F9ZX38_METMM|nr:anti-phage dCTP deaminase [Methylomonas methanica]AEF98499.1 CMP/dCMP deaminase zinc-binding protein [Methylomonas methanica MC09]
MSKPYCTQEDFNDSELIIGLVGPVGVDFGPVIEYLQSQLSKYIYETKIINVSETIIPMFVNIEEKQSPYENAIEKMDKGDDARSSAGENSILAKGVAAYIASKREKKNQHRPRVAYIVKSLKHPKEVTRLQSIYPHGFYLIGVNSSIEKRKDFLRERKGMKPSEVDALIKLDEDGRLDSGQHTSDTFHLADFFINLDNEDTRSGSKKRILQLLFGHPFITPLFDEYAMFMAFTASLRSADLSRQVGAAIAHNEELLAVGANDCPKFEGGLYWPHLQKDGSTEDKKGGRDYTRNVDANRDEQLKIIEDICNAAKEKGVGKQSVQKFREVLDQSRINDLMEFGRMVHAEMEALLSCARRGVSTKSASLYSTTFPCHNCAKHIVASGIKRVVYVEPYPKSKAFDLHDDAISADKNKKDVVIFEPFEGVSPRRFFDLFSMNLSHGRKLKRKNKQNGNSVTWSEANAKLRIQMLPQSYLQLEEIAAFEVNDLIQKSQITDKEEL